jgi:hypothetical protein
MDMKGSVYAVAGLLHRDDSKIWDTLVAEYRVDFQERKITRDNVQLVMANGYIGPDEQERLLYTPQAGPHGQSRVSEHVIIKLFEAWHLLGGDVFANIPGLSARRA